MRNVCSWWIWAPLTERGEAGAPGMELTGESVPKEGRVELSAFIEIIWKKKNPSEMALPRETQDLCFSPDALGTAVRLGPDAGCPVCLRNGVLRWKGRGPTGRYLLQDVGKGWQCPCQCFRARRAAASPANTRQGCSHLHREHEIYFRPHSRFSLQLWAPSFPSPTADSPASPHCTQAWTK